MIGRQDSEASGVPRVDLMFHRIVLNRTWPADRPILIRPSSLTVWGEMTDLVNSLKLDESRLARRRVGVPFRPVPLCLAALALLDRLDCDTFLMDGRLGRDAAIELGRELRLSTILIVPEGPDAVAIEPVALTGEMTGSGKSSVTILTSGTTGKPKAARHTWSSLSRPVRTQADSTGPRWLLTYRPHLYAGTQVLLQCLTNGGALVVPETDALPSDVAELMQSARVEYASATPSYWRRLLLFTDPALLAASSLVQITLGGEVADQQILNALSRAFPATRIVHIYATTELGRCFSVTDGKAGFPARYLREPTPDGVLLRVEDGELVVRSANAMHAYDEAGENPSSGTLGHRTGDLVEVTGERVYFIGRRSDMINVGGNKVHPVEVERVLLGVPGVAHVRVYSKRSSIAGELVAVEVVPGPGIDTSQLREAIVAACMVELSPFQRPRLVDFVAEIALEDSGKLKRRLFT
jgi:acyl-CoA synthetase (AMP-forming)/AMP-acid ligase II